MQQMIETLLAPAHSNAFEALLDEPFARTLDQPAPQRQTQFLELCVVNMFTMRLQISVLYLWVVVSDCESLSTGNTKSPQCEFALRILTARACGVAAT